MNRIATPLTKIITLAVFVCLSLATAEAADPWRVSATKEVTTLPSGATLLRLTVTGDDSVDLRIVRFSSQRCSLQVIDQARSEAVDLNSAMLRAGAIAGVNGGFFTPQFEPLGLVVARGQRIGTWQRSSLLGGVIMVRKGRLLLLWRDEFQDGPGITELLQTGPRLVNNGLPVTGLENQAERPRSFIATDNAGQWLIGTAEYTTLAGLAQILSLPDLIAGMEIVRALNFDGGKSTAFWARSETGTVFSEPGLAVVRNFVAIVPRK